MEKIINVFLIACFVLIFFFISFLDSKLEVKTKKKLLILVIILITLFLGYRSIGLDLEQYRVIFESQEIILASEFFSTKIFSGFLEPFFVVLISLFKRYGLSFNFFLLITGGIPLFIIYNVIRKKEDKYILVTFFFFFLLNFIRGPVDIIRHFFAASIYLSALYSLSERNKIKFWTKSIFSMMVHYSNVIILFIKPLLNIKWNTLRYIISSTLIALCGLFINFLLKNFYQYGIYNFENPIMWKADYYLNYYNVGAYQYSGLLHRILLLIMNYFPILFNIFYIFLALKKIKWVEKDTFYRLLLNSQIIGSLLAIFFMTLNAETLGYRLNFLLGIGSFLLVKELIFNYYKDKKLILFIFTVLSLVLYNFILVLYFAGIHDPKSPFFLS